MSLIYVTIMVNTHFKTFETKWWKWKQAKMLKWKEQIKEMLYAIKTLAFLREIIFTIVKKVTL